MESRASILDQLSKAWGCYNIDKIVRWTTFLGCTCVFHPVLELWTGWVVSKMDGWTLLEMLFWTERENIHISLLSAVLPRWTVENVSVLWQGVQTGNMLFQKTGWAGKWVLRAWNLSNWQSNHRVARTDQQPTQIYSGHFELRAIMTAVTRLCVL